MSELNLAKVTMDVLFQNDCNPFSRRRHKRKEVTIIVGDEDYEFKVNLKALGQISPVFKTWCNRPIYKVRISDTDPNTFDCVLQYAYGHGPTLSDDNIANVHRICGKYKISTLQKICEAVFKFSFFAYLLVI